MSNTVKFHIAKSTSSPSVVARFSRGSVAGGVVRVTRASGASREDPEGKISTVESAVFAHIQAMRALGRDSLNTAEIARALGLTQAQVLLAARRLRDKGVKAGVR